MLYLLPCIVTLVDHQPMAVLQPLLVGHFLCGREQGAQHSGVLLIQLSQEGEVLVRNNQYMCGRFWGSVSDSEAVVIAVKFLAGNLAVADLTEDAIIRHCRTPVHLADYNSRS